MTDNTQIRPACFAALVAGGILAAVPAVAQNDMTGSAASGAGSTADQMTCAELSRMDTAVVPGTLYFVAGYRRGQEDSMNLTDRVQSGSSDTTGTDTTAATGADTTTTTDSGATTDGTSDGSSESSTMTDNTDTEGTQDMSNGTAQIGRLSGYFEIPVEQVMTVCGESPDRPVSDVVEEQRGMNGSDSN